MRVHGECFKSLFQKISINYVFSSVNFDYVATVKLARPPSVTPRHRAVRSFQCNSFYTYFKKTYFSNRLRNSLFTLFIYSSSNLMFTSNKTFGMHSYKNNETRELYFC